MIENENTHDYIWFKNLRTNCIYSMDSVILSSWQGMDKREVIE